VLRAESHRLLPDAVPPVPLGVDGRDALEDVVHFRAEIPDHLERHSGQRDDVRASTLPELPGYSPGLRPEVQITPTHLDRLARPLTEEQERLHHACYLERLRNNIGRLTVEGFPERYDLFVLEDAVPAPLSARPLEAFARA
jgi:hypothetical protein